jgi:hypothetical protein
MNLYSLNKLVNSIHGKRRKSNSDCLYLNELLNDAVIEGYSVVFDNNSDSYLITREEYKNVP